MIKPFQFFCPTQIMFGANEFDKTLEIIKKLKYKKVLVTAGKTVSQQELFSNFFSKLKAELDVFLYNSCPPEPTSSQVNEAYIKVKGFEADAIVAIGGGSVIDFSKALALCLVSNQKIEDYEFNPVFPKSLLPIIAVPTTAGSGSEVTPYTVINNSVTGRKFTLNSSIFYPQYAIVDPLFLMTLPKDQILATGLDAWVHSYEAIISNQENDFIKNIAQKSLQNIFEVLPRATTMSPSIDDCSQLSLAALQSGLVISNVRTGLVHTMSVALAKHCDYSHGYLNAILTFTSLNYNHDIAQERLFRFGGFEIEYIKSWLSEMGIPKNLKHLGLKASLVPQLVDRAMQDKGLPTVNPRPIDAVILEKLFKEVICVS